MSSCSFRKYYIIKFPSSNLNETWDPAVLFIMHSFTLSAHLLLLVSACFFLPVVSLSVAWNDPPNIRTGEINIVSILTTSQDPAIQVIATYATPLSAPYSSAYFYGISKSSFDLWMTEEFSFNTSITAVQPAYLSVTYQVLGESYVQMARLNYIVGLTGLANYSLFVTVGCFLTANLWATDASIPNVMRSQTVGPPLLSPFFSASSMYAVSSMVSGMLLKNQLGPYNYMQVLNNVPSGSNNLTFTIKVGPNDYLMWICLTTVIVDMSLTASTYNLVLEYVPVTLTQNKTLSGIPYSARYDGRNRMFFGFSSLNITTSANRYLNVDNFNISYVSSLYATNSALNFLRYEMIFYVARTCIGITYYIPTAYDCFATCNSNQVPVGGSSMLCLACSYPCATCAPLNINLCLTCNVSMNRDALVTNGTCYCAIGYVETNTASCPPCEQYLSGCTICSSTTVCTNCSSAYVLNLTSNKCDCNTGYFLVTTYCLSYPGCLNAFYMTTGIQCNSCDNVTNFVLNTNLYTCQCNLGYLPQPNNTCADTCGDGLTPNTPGKCDDGNILNGDGCSSNCFVETGWHCTYDNVAGGISTCVKIVPIAINYLYSERIVNKNQANIYFSVTPFLPGLTALSFKNSITTSIPSSSQIVTFNPLTCTIAIDVAYSQTIEKTTQKLSVVFEHMAIYADAIKMSFTPYGINAQLTYDTFQTQNPIISYMATALSAIAVLMAIFAAVVGLKLVGMELLLPVQLIYFALSIVQFPMASIFSLNSLKYSNGFNFLTTYSYDRSYSSSKNLINIEYENEFLLSCNIMCVIYSISLLLILIQHIIIKRKQFILARLLERTKAPQESTQMKDENDESIKVKDGGFRQRPSVIEESNLRMSIYYSFKLFTFEVDRIYFILFVVILNELLFAFLLAISNQPKETFLFGVGLNITCCGVLMGILLINFPFMQHDQSTTKIIRFNCLNEHYGFVYLLLNLMTVLLISLLSTFHFTSYLLPIMGFMFVLLVTIQRPYSTTLFTLQNIIATYLQLTLLASFSLICYLNVSESASELTSLICAYLICGLIFIGEVLTVIRLVLRVNFKKAFDDLKNQDPDDTKQDKKVIEKKLDQVGDETQILMIPSTAVREGLLLSKDRMIDWESRNTSEYDSLHKNGNADVDAISEARMNEKMNELEMIKRKLKNSLREKQRSELQNSKQKGSIEEI